MPSCSKCGNQFDSDQALMIHLQSQHPQPQPKKRSMWQQVFHIGKKDIHVES